LTRPDPRDQAALTVTVLGAVSPYPGRGVAGPGYLVEGFGARILLECGSGVLSRLVAYCDYADLDAVVLSHLHFDHCSDAFVLRYALDAATRSGRLGAPVPVWCPAEPGEVAAFMTYKDAMEARTIRPGSSMTVGGMTVTFHPARHPVETYHVTFASTEAPDDGPLLFYTADTEWYDGLPGLAGTCRVLIAEASLAARQEALATSTGHLTAAQAARLGSLTSAERTVLTHYPPDRDPADIEAEAAEASGRPVTVAVEGLRITWP